jgi:hypothetical protein
MGLAGSRGTTRNGEITEIHRELTRSDDILATSLCRIWQQIYRYQLTFNDREDFSLMGKTTA